MGTAGHLEDLAEVPEVEGVVALGRGGQQPGADRVVYVEAGRDQLPVALREVLAVLAAAHPPVHQRPEDGVHGGLVKLRNADHVEVAQVAVGHVVPASARRPHRCDELHVLDVPERVVLAVVPGITQSQAVILHSLQSPKLQRLPCDMNGHIDNSILIVSTDFYYRIKL
eukprot:scaffold244945_cov49-Prasinocladus_malaysianus.AAC.2